VGGHRKTYIKMISAFLRRKFPSFLNKVSELRLSSLELSSFVVRRNPIGDFPLSLRPELAFRCRALGKVAVPFLPSYL
jgi:hypothetical protein